MKNPSDLSLQRAAQAWCGKKTSHKEMDADLALEFARILDKDLLQKKKKAIRKLEKRNVNLQKRNSSLLEEVLTLALNPESVEAESIIASIRISRDLVRSFFSDGFTTTASWK